MNSFRKITFFILLSALFVSCGKEDIDAVQKPKEREDIVLTKAQEKYVKSGNSFSKNLFKNVLEKQDGSFMLSPLSVQYALAMLGNGASGIALDEILSALAVGADDLESLNEYYQYITKKLGEVDNTAKISLSNALVYNTVYSSYFKDTFSKTLVNYYDALVEGYNFAAENEKAVSRINSWASRNTNGMINNLVSHLDPSDALLLLNAIYFKGQWLNKFSSSDTKQGEFIKETGDKMKVEYMNAERKCMYYTGDRFSSVQLAYGNGAFVMSVYLPAEGHTVSELSNLMCRGEAEPGYSSLYTVDLKMPKFSTESDINLVDALMASGLQSLFSDNADFSGISNVPLMVSKFLQKSNIKVSETGTEAAAVTEVHMGFGAPLERKAQFHATRPFIYVISETSTGAVLFMGVYNGQ